MALKPFSCTTGETGCFGSFEALAITVYYAAGRTADGNGTWRGADVINISYTFNPNTVDTTALNWATSNGRNGKGTPVFASTGNSASGAKYAWVDVGIPGGSLAPGAQVQFRYSKDGSVSSGDDAVWINWAKIPGGTVERFDNETGPPGWDSDGNGDLEWEFSTNPPETARAAGTGRFPYRSGPITHSQTSSLISPEFAVSGSFEFNYWISSEANFDKLEVLVRHRDIFGVWFPWTVTDIKSYDSNGNTVANASVSGIAEFTPNAAYPANLDSVIGVGASTDWDYKASYSQYGPGLDIVAPSGGGNIDFWTTDRTGAAGYSTSDYAAVQGTSVASPLAAGVGALMLSRNPELTAAQLQTLMQDTAEEIGSVSYPGGWNQFYGHGRINAHQAVLAAGVDSDDRISQATTISVNATTTGRLGTTTDVDFFQINVGGGDRISIDLDHLSTDLNTDTFVRLFDSAGAELASSDDTAGPAPEVSGFESYVEFTAPANGAYYIGVSAFGNQNYNPINGTGKTDALPNKLGNYLLRVNNVSSSMLLVSLNDDAGDGRYFKCVTLRESIAYANQLFTIPTIQFDTVGLFSTPQTINLSGGQGALPISRSMNINGANRVTVNAQSSSRVFYVDDGTPAVRFVSLSGMTIRGGSAPSGAGILNRENLTLTEVLVTANTTSGDGGGIWNGGQLQVTRSAIANNTANRGGGVYLAVAGNTTTISETTLSGNNAGTGGGIANFAGTANIQRATISGNQSGIWSEGNAATTFTNVQSSIVSGNTSGDVIRDGAFFVTIASQGFNLVGNGTAVSAFGQATDLVGVNPLLGPFGNNGGPTPSHPLLPGSPAVNRGNPSIATPPALDQRGTGFSRIRGGVIDIGAFEAQPPAVGDFGNLVQPSTTQRNYTLRANEVVFHQFTLTAPVQAASGQFLVIDTLGTTLAPSNDTEIGLYDASGNRIADNDDGIGLMSRLSFGNTAGSSGDLPAGTYYLAATAFPTTFGNFDFNVTSTSGNTGNVRVNIQLGTTAVPAAIVGSFVNHVGYTGSGSSIDTGKVLAKEGASSQQLGFNNLINTTRGINGLAFDIANLPGSITDSDFIFQMSPLEVFSEAANPVSGWQSAPDPGSVTVQPGLPSRVLITWPDNAIANRWLRVTVKANANTGLAAPEVYYLGHLQGESTGPSGGKFTVLVADILAVRAALSQSATASSIVDLDKSGVVLVADILAARSQLSKELTQITIPAAGGGGGGGIVEEDGLVGSAEDSSLAPTPTESLRLLSNPSMQAAAYASSVDRALDDLYSTTQRRRGRRS